MRPFWHDSTTQWDSARDGALPETHRPAVYRISHGNIKTDYGKGTGRAPSPCCLSAAVTFVARVAPRRAMASPIPSPDGSACADSEDRYCTCGRAD